MPVKNFDTLLEDLKNEQILNQMGPGLALLKPGDWKGLVKWGAHFGYVFTLQDVSAYFSQNPKIFTMLSKNSFLSGWSSDSLSNSLKTG